MAGTNSSRAAPPLTEGLAIVLVGPQLGENIGAVARAMLNCALGDLRLVRPRDGWPNPQAWPMASGADAVLDQARVFESVHEAVADLGYVLGTTARHRDQVKDTWTAAAAAREVRRREATGERCGMLFGPERIGLTNDEVALVDAIVKVPLNPSFSSLNLAQAVLIVAYEHRQAGLDVPERSFNPAGSRPATREELFNFFDHLESALDAVDFWKTAELRPGKVRNLRNLLHRAGLTEQEVRSLHGVVSSLIGRKRKDL